MLPKMSFWFGILLMLIGLLLGTIEIIMEVIYPPLSAICFIIYCFWNIIISPFISEGTYEQYSIINWTFHRLLVVLYVYMFIKKLFGYSPGDNMVRNNVNWDPQFMDRMDRQPEDRQPGNRQHADREPVDRQRRMNMNPTGRSVLEERQLYR